MKVTTIGCLLPDCGAEHYARGLCKTHYNIANRLVRRQQTSWDELAANGKCFPSRGWGGRLADTDRTINWLLDPAPKEK